MARFVLLYHNCPPEYGRASHWDLMLESGEVLRTWAVERLPRSWEAWRERTAARFPNCAEVAEGEELVAMPLGDHRRRYLEYEGEISGGRGSVVRVARGEYEVEQESEGAWLVALREEGATRRVRIDGVDVSD